MGRKLITSAALMGACATSMFMSAPATAQNSRVSASEKGSLLIYSKIDVCYSDAAATTLVLDSYVTMNNDQGADVQVQCYFIQVDVTYDTDTPLGDDYIDYADCSGLDFQFELTANQPRWWKASDGTTSAGAGFAPAFPGVAKPFQQYWCKRGFILCWAVNGENEEIRFNQLSGGVTIVDSNLKLALEYTAYTAAVVSAAAEGAATGTPGDLHLDGVEYASGFDFLLVDFFAVGANPFAGATALNTYLWLMPLDQNLAQSNRPTITKADILVWNENEFKTSGTRECFACWIQQQLSAYDQGGTNGFLRTVLNTDKGRARIDGVAHNSEIAPPFCFSRFNDDDESLPPIGTDPRDVLSVNTSLVGGSAKYLTFPAGLYAASGTHLVGTGTQAALIQWDHDAVGGGGGGGGSPETPETSAPIIKAVDAIVKKNRK